MGKLATYRKTVEHRPQYVRWAIEQVLMSLDWVVETSGAEHLSASLVELWTEDIDQFELDYQLQAFFKPHDLSTELTVEIWEQQRDWTDSECQTKLLEIMDALPKKLGKKQIVAHP